MSGKIVEFAGKKTRIAQLTEKALEDIPEDMRESYRTNTPSRILLKFDLLDAESQNVMFDYLMFQARKSGRLNKSNFVIKLLNLVGGQNAWEEVEDIADSYLLKGAYKNGKN